MAQFGSESHRRVDLRNCQNGITTERLKSELSWATFCRVDLPPKARNCDMNFHSPGGVPCAVQYGTIENVLERDGTVSPGKCCGLSIWKEGTGCNKELCTETNPLTGLPLTENEINVILQNADVIRRSHCLIPRKNYDPRRIRRFICYKVSGPTALPVPMLVDWNLQPEPGDTVIHGNIFPGTDQVKIRDIRGEVTDDQGLKQFGGYIETSTDLSAIGWQFCSSLLFATQANYAKWLKAAAEGDDDDDRQINDDYVHALVLALDNTRLNDSCDAALQAHQLICAIEEKEGVTFEQVKQLIQDRTMVQLAFHSVEEYLLVCNAEEREARHAAELYGVLDDMLELHIAGWSTSLQRSGELAKGQMEKQHEEDLIFSILIDIDSLEHCVEGRQGRETRKEIRKQLVDFFCGEHEWEKLGSEPFVLRARAKNETDVYRIIREAKPRLSAWAANHEVVRFSKDKELSFRYTVAQQILDGVVE